MGAGIAAGIWLGGALLGIMFAETAFPAKLCSRVVTYYEVMIDDDVSLNDFNEKYEVVEQRGKIYVVQEKETKGE